MTLLNSILAWGALACAIPLIIHILNRSRFRTVDWGAMHLLEAVVKVNHRRFRVDQLILLLLRCSLPIVLAFCLARPVLTGSALLEGDAPLALVLILDTSYSMDSAMNSTPAGGTRFDAAVDAACRIIEATGRGSQFAVIQAGGRPAPLFDEPLLDAGTMTRRLRQLRANHGACDMSAALAQAVRVLDRMSHARREVVVISDFQSDDWGTLGEGTGESLRRSLAALAVPPVLTLLSIGSPLTENISVDQLTIPQRAVGVGQQLTVRATVQNHGPLAREAVRLVLKVDGSEASVTQIALPAQGSAQTLFTCRLDSAGSYVLEVQAVADDALLADNRFAAAVTVWENVPVLLVDGDPSSRPLQGETDYLSVALTPFTLGRVRLEDLIQTRTVPLPELDVNNLHASRVVVLANVVRLSAEQLASLSTWVRDGGALMICAGSRLDTVWYNDSLFHVPADQRLLPLAFGALRGDAEVSQNGAARSEAPAPGAARILAQHRDHASLELFNDPANGDLSTAEIRRWYDLTGGSVPDGTNAAPPADSATASAADSGSASDATVLLRLNTGEPLLVERRCADGVVLQLATAIDADWSDLPLRPFYVPLMQQLVTSVASSLVPPRNLQTGEPAVALYADSMAEDPAVSASLGGNSQVTVVTPGGSRHVVAAQVSGTQRIVQFDATQQPGVYSMTLPSAQTIHFVAETSRTESRLPLLDELQLNRLAEHLQATAVHSPEAYLEMDHHRRYGRELWKYLLAAWVLLMSLELVLQQRFARVSP